MISKLVLLVGFLLVGCVIAPKEIVGPDGTPHQLIRCGSIETCYSKAAEICGKYKIVNTSTSVSGTETMTDSTTELLVKCEGK